MDIGTAKPTPADRAEIAHHGLDLADPAEDFTVVATGRAYDAAMAGIADRGHRAVLVGGTGLYLRAVIDGLDPPGEWPAVRAELEAEPDTAALYDRLRRLDPAAAAKMEPTNRRRVVRALEVYARQRPAVQHASAPASTPTRRPTSSRSACAGPATELTRRIEARFAQLARRRLPRRGAHPGRPARRAVPHRPPGHRLRRAARRRSPAAPSLDEADRAAPWPAPGASPSARSGGSGAIPGFTGSTSTTTRWSPCLTVLGALTACV